GERLLVVDDEADIRRTVAELLQDQGYRVVTAASGEEGLKLLATEPPAMVLLDCSMPGMSGLEVARRARHAFPALPILFITAYADRVLLASQFPQHRVLAKPFKSEDLFAAVAERLRI
ncbi:MAG TPA: response regulator, partial [Roseateles sp.]|nr:response regulator [Roseateles sp.]